MNSLLQALFLTPELRYALCPAPAAAVKHPSRSPQQIISLYRFCMGKMIGGRVDQWQFTPGRDDTNGRTRDTCIPYQLQRL
jgi:hypothetical protein